MLLSDILRDFATKFVGKEVTFNDEHGVIEAIIDFEYTRVLFDGEEISDVVPLNKLHIKPNLELMTVTDLIELINSKKIGTGKTFHLAGLDYIMRFLDDSN